MLRARKFSEYVFGRSTISLQIFLLRLSQHRSHCGDRRHEIRARLDGGLKFVEAVFSVVTTAGIDLAIARAHAAIWAHLAARGEPIGAHDLWIAATAAANQWKLATRNEREFASVDNLEVCTW